MLFLSILFSSNSIYAEVSNFELLKKKVMKNSENSDDLYNLAMIYYYDRSKLNLELAKYYMTIAANKGNPNALYELGMMYSVGGTIFKTDSNGVGKEERYWSEDMGKAVYFLSMAAEKGNIKAQSYLGNAYKMGYKVPKNISKAKYYLKKAAEQGDENAMDTLKYMP